MNKIKSNFLSKLIDGFLGQVSISLLSIFLTFLIAKLYGAKVFGEYTYIITTINMISVFVRMGIDNSLMYFIINKGNKYNILSFTIIFIMSLLVSIYIFFFVNNSLLKIASPLIFLLASQELFFAIFRSQGKIKDFFLIKIFSNSVVQILLVILYSQFYTKTSLDLITIFYISNIMALIIYYLVTKKSFLNFYMSIDFIKYAIPTMFISFVGILMNRIDIVMIGNLMPIENVGLYQVVAQISTLISFSIAIFNIAFAPKIAELYKQGNIIKLKYIYMKSTRILFLVSSLLFFVLFIYKKNILGYFGDSFESVDDTLIIRSLGQLFVVFVGSVGFMLTMIGKVKAQLFRIILASAVNIVLNYLLIPLYGLNGAAVASLIALMVSSFAGYILVYRVFAVKVYKIF